MLSDSDKEELEFFGCLRLANGTIIENRNSLLTVSLLDSQPHQIIYLRTGPQSSDVLVFKQIICWKEYKSVVQVFKNNFHEDATNILDAGENIGLSILYFFNSFQNATIVCVEPDTENFNILTANLSQQNAKCIHGAVWSKNCKL